MHTNMQPHIPVPCYCQREYDYAVHFVCRHPPDRCICRANLDGFSVWILNQNHIFPLFLVRQTFMPAVSSASHRTHSLTKQWWKKTSFWILILTACWACVMNASSTYSSICTAHIRWQRSSLPLSSFWLFSDKLCCNRIFCIFSFLLFSFLVFSFYAYLNFSHSFLSSLLLLLLSRLCAQHSRIARMRINRGRKHFNFFFHSVMNIQCKQFLCMAVKSHVCLLKG